MSILGYDNLFKAFNLGTGSAISVLVFLCVALIAALFIKGFGTSAPGARDEGGDGDGQAQTRLVGDQPVGHPHAP